MAKIFLMEDSPPLRRILVRQIRDAGHTVAAFENGEQSQNRGIVGDADVLITDLSMPGIDGETVIRNVSRLRPNLPIIVISGSVPDTIAKMKTVDIVLQKPFGEEKLIGAIDTVLHKHGRGNPSNESHKETQFREKTMQITSLASGKRSSRIASAIRRLLGRGRDARTFDYDDLRTHALERTPVISSHEAF